MKSSPRGSEGQSSGWNWREPGAGATLLALSLVLLVLMGGVLLPGYTLFSNDGPLGRLLAECHRLPARFSGCWEDINGIGAREGAALPNLSFGLQWLLGPVFFSKLYVPLTLLLLGMSAWCFFRRMRLAAPACLLGGVAAALNSDFFSTACWGVAAHTLTVAMTLLALAALADSSAPRVWVRTALAGLAVGMGVAEGADLGAIFSLFVAAFLLWQVWSASGSRVRTAALGAGRLTLVVLCAVLLSAQALSELTSNNIEGIAGTAQDAQTKSEHWDWATQWSLPKKEALSLVMPGLFGYRMDTKEGGAYWGAIGRSAAWEKYLQDGQQGALPTGFLRFVGGGFYAGVPVVLVAVWAALQSLRRKGLVFDLSQRKWLWFWLATAVVSLLLAFGRHAPFYRAVYALPYFSTIRNPVKFLHLLSLALVVLFAYGVDGLWRCYLVPARAEGAGSWGGWKSWWSRAAAFDRRWVYGCGAVLALSLVGWMVYGSYRASLVEYLESVQFHGAAPAQMADFSIRQVGLFVIFFGLSALLMGLMLSGAFARRQAVQGIGLLAVLLAVDFAHANVPWVRLWNYPDKYASNPIVDLLREKPYDHRVAFLNFPPSAKYPALVREFNNLKQVYELHWLQQLFSYYNVQSLENVQLPRVPVDLKAYEHALEPNDPAKEVPYLFRRFQLTDTRYLIATRDVLNFLQRKLDAAQYPFHVVQYFDLAPKPGVTTVSVPDELTASLSPQGRLALLQLDSALPRALLYTNWQVSTNDQQTLDVVSSPEFNPQQKVLVAESLPATAAAGDLAKTNGVVEFTHYAPKHMELKAEAVAPSVLLLNDHFAPHWRVLVDGKPEKLLRCNFIMRGVYLSPGVHRVEFSFEPPVKPLYVSLAGVGIGVLLLAWVGVAGYRGAVPAPGHTEPRAAQRPPENEAPEPVGCVAEAVPAGASAEGTRPKSHPRRKRR